MSQLSKPLVLEKDKYRWIAYLRKPGHLPHWKLYRKGEYGNEEYIGLIVFYDIDLHYIVWSGHECIPQHAQACHSLIVAKKLVETNIALGLWV